MKSFIVKNNFTIKKNSNVIKFSAFDVNHGLINATGYLFNKIAYISDCKKIPNSSLKKLFNLDFLIVDCLRKKEHPGHMNYIESLKLIKYLNPKKAILTNLHVDLDYDILKKKLPPNIIPAFDGLSFNF